MYREGNKNISMLILILLAGVVIGGFIGDYLGTVSFLKWLNYGQKFGITSPLVLDLGVITFQVALSIKLTIAGILGIFISYLAYRKL